MILWDPNAGSKITISKPGGETPEQILDLLKRNFFLTFLPPIVRMICGRRKYSSKYGMVESGCNMSLVSQGKGLTFVAPGQELTHHFFSTFLPPRLGWNPGQRTLLTPPPPPLLLARGLCVAVIG